MEQRLQPCPDSSLKHRKRSEVTRCIALNEQHAKEYEKSMVGGELKVLLEEEVGD